MNKLLTDLGLTLLVLFIAFGILYPDSFDNNPDLIQDESYFLTSALSSLQHHTIPGFEFSSSGSYYGGLQTYVDTAVMIPVLAVMLAGSHFSLLSAEVAIALHTGDLLHILRIVDGLLAVGLIAFLIWYFRRRSIPRELALSFLLLLFLVLGNSVVIGLLHTAKVWVLYLVIEAGIGTVFLAQEYYRSRGEEPFLSAKTYTAVLVWGAALAFSQTFVGAFSAFLWMVYARLLGHITVKDIWLYIWKRWHVFAAFLALHASFLYRAFFGRGHSSLLNFGDFSNETADHGIDWFHRLYDPLAYAVSSQPLILLYIIGIMLAGFVFLARRKEAAPASLRTYIGIAIAHPVLTYLFYYGLVGFTLFPRYSLMLALACAFSSVMLLSLNRYVLRAGLAVAGILFVIVVGMAIPRFWQPSSAALLRDTIAAKYNAADAVFVIDPATARLGLPLNRASLLALNDRRANLTRFQFLKTHLGETDPAPGFLPLVIFADTPAEYDAALTEHKKAAGQLWSITQDCAKRCTANEAAAGSCFEVNPGMCRALTVDDREDYPVTLLPAYLSESGLGLTYIARRIK